MILVINLGSFIVLVLQVYLNSLRRIRLDNGWPSNLRSIRSGRIASIFNSIPIYFLHLILHFNLKLLLIT